MATCLHRPKSVEIVATSSTGAGDALSLVKHPDEFADGESKFFESQPMRFSLAKSHRLRLEEFGLFEKCGLQKVGWWTTSMFDDKDAFITFDLGEMFRLHAIHIKAPSNGAPRFITVEVYESIEVYNAHWSRDTYRFETNIEESISGMQRYTINGVEGMAYGRIVRVHLSYASGMAFWIALNHILFYGVSMGERQPEESELFVDGWSGKEDALGPVPGLQDLKDHKGPIEWVRPSTFFRARDIILFSRVGPSDIRQGKLADCWLLAAFAAVAEVPKYIESLFQQKEVNPFGRYVIRLFDPCAAQWVDIEIDDRIPCIRTEDGYESLGTNLTSDSELWVCLLEKAFARLGGSYYSIYGAYPTFALAVLVGSTKVHTLRKFELEPPKPVGNGQVVPAKPLGWEKFVHVIRSNVATLNPVLQHDRWSDDGCCGSLRRNDSYILDSLEFLLSSNYLVAADTFGESDRDVRQGIVQRHAYTLLRVVKNVAGTNWNLLLIRNPWGHTEFEGRWSIGHEIWQQFPQVRKELHPEHAATQSPKGTFWMCDIDFFNHFKSVYLCAHPVHGPRRWAVDLQEEQVAEDCLVRDASNQSFPLIVSESVENVINQVKSHFKEHAWVEYFSEVKRTWIPGFIPSQDDVGGTDLDIDCIDGSRVTIDLMTDVVRHRHVLYRAKRDPHMYYCIVVSSDVDRKRGLCLMSVDGLRVLKHGATADQSMEGILKSFL